MSRSALGAAVGLLLGAALWWAWLGHDDEPSYDSIADRVQDPYTTLQVLGCALTVALVTVVLSALTEPIAAAVGIGAGFWTAWTVHASRTDDSGLFIVGAAMLAAGLLVGLTVCAALGHGVRVLRARRSERTVGAR
ncbi:hypothetical protein G7072_06260 [Nocardioides sp. HDW12B]|uniref:hypothetical protein n=1 Tax=Nocardioides sp. HDW12B TaxID=2714939 RepID=UPI00140D4289|nr:hypothetical protein [Nocardioides sp. HDW12B]QIK65994.1 hypothetical protein G7072_06260 [Nocardioides sp. HDW12B]